MKNLAVILATCTLFACNSDNGNHEDEHMKDTANDIASRVTGGATAETHEATGDYKKYAIKSGIVTYETNMEISGMKLKSTKILYFDNYGTTECEEEYKNNPVTGKEELDSRTFVKDGYRYSLSMNYKNGARTKAQGYGVAAVFNMDEAKTLKENNFKALGNETVCGKECESFSIETASGKLIMNGWNNIALKTVLDNASSKMRSVTLATKIEENASIPADKFEVPKDIVITNM